MKKKMVEYDIDLVNPPALTAEQVVELNALRAKPDSEIDYSDIPPLQESFWKKAVQNPFYRPPRPRPPCALIPMCCIGCALMAEATSRASMPFCGVRC